ncbi:MAG: c-type cytochrome, partial [Planctomycetota bacterium]|nr:c-type cytochrome [Planctomycetota bacterium]
SAAERAALTATSPPPKPVELPQPQGPGQAWTLDTVVAVAPRTSAGRDFENGKRTFAAARCIVCHRFDGEGGATGPDLTNVAGRFSHRDLADALITPSKVISDQYGASIIETADGKLVTGRVVGDDGKTITVQTDPEDATKVLEIANDNIELLEPSRTSLMPEKLLDVLSEQEVLDLLAFLLSRGNPEDPMFNK